MPMLPESLSTGTITPSEVATSTIATNSGDLTNPPAFRPRPSTIAIANDTAKPSAVSFRTLPRRRSTSISRPERNSRNASPTSARIDTGRSGLTQPSPEGPITMPSTISSTIAGSRRPREEAERQRGEQGHRDDNQQIGEVDVGHGAVVSLSGLPLHQWPTGAGVTDPT